MAKKILISILLIWVIISVIFILRFKKSESELKINASNFQAKINDLENVISNLESTNKAQQTEILNMRLRELNRTSFRQNSSSSNSQIIDNSEVYLSQGSATVVYRKSGCDYFILENNMGYIIAEWMGGNDPDKGDRIAGKFDSFGTEEFYNTSMGSTTNLWIDDYMLSKDDALEKIADKCN